MTLTLAGIECPEMAGSGEISTQGHGGGESLRRIYRVAWADRLRFMSYLRGSILIEAGDTAVFAPPADPQYESLHVDSLTMRGHGKMTGDAEDFAQYQYAVFEVAYTPLTLGTEDEDLADIAGEDIAARINWDFGGEWMEVPAPQYQISAADPPMEGTETLFVGEAQLNVTVYRVPHFNKSNIFAVLGGLNSASWFGLSTKHVLYMGPAAEREVTTDLTLKPWSVTHRFLVRGPCAWDQVRSGGAWKNVTEVTGAGSKYPVTWSVAQMRAILRGNA